MASSPASSPGRRGSISSLNSAWLNVVTPPPASGHHPGDNNANANSNIAGHHPKSYGNKHVDAELEALKQRGLAKLLNKHFTETALLLEQEKAAADAALRDLEERKARTSEYEIQYRNGEISPLDEMCLQANKWRAECRRKEKETMLLYQRYVHRFGDTLHSIGGTGTGSPHNNNNNYYSNSCNNTNPMHHSTASPDQSPATAAPPPSKAPFLAKPKIIDPAAPTTTATTSKPPTSSSTSTQIVPNMAKQIEATLEEYLKQGAVSMPSLQTLGKDETYHNVHQKEEEQFRNFYRRQLEQKGIDVKYPGFSLTNRPDFPGFPIHTIEERGGATNNKFKTSDGDDNDDDSVMSELTTLQSVIIQDCERSVVTYLQEEHQKIQSLVGQQGDDYDEDDTESAISQAESMVQQMEEILAEYQNNRSLSVQSANAKMTKHHAPREYPTDNPNECWMVYYDEFYQQDYYHEKFTNRTQWEPPNGSANNHNDGTSCSSAATLTIAEVMPDMRVYRQRRRAKRRSRRTVLLIAMMTVLGAIVAAIWNHDIHTQLVLRTLLLPETLLNKCYKYWRQSDDPITAVVTTSSRGIVIPEPTRAAIVSATPTAHNDKVVTATLVASKELMSSRERVSVATAKVISIQSNDCVDKNYDSHKLVDNLRRPWLCNLPLAWLFHSRCWMLAGRNPLFDAQELIMSMLQ